MKSRYRYEIQFEENDACDTAIIYANREDEAIEYFYDDHPDAEILNISEYRNEPDYEHF